METASMGGSPSGERAAKRLRRDNDSHVGNNSGIQLPPEIWVGVLGYLPQGDVLTFGAVSSSMLRDVMPLLSCLHIDKSSQMNLAVARRFRDVETIHINSLLTSVFVDVVDGEDWREISVDHESSSRAVPFLSRFVMLQRVAFGVKNEAGTVLDNVDIASELFWEGEELYPNEGSRESMLHFLDSISIGYRCGALPKHLKVSGVCCPDSNNRRGFGQCETCLRACRSFPLQSVVGFECRGSSASNATSGRFHGLDVCLERARVESIIESRPGGPELLRSEERVLRLLGSARRYKISSDAGHVYIVKYTKTEMNEIKRVIKYADLDAKKIHAQTVSDAIMKSFVGNGSTAPSSRGELCYVSEESLGYLKDVVGLSISTDDLERPLIGLAKHTQRITSALVDFSGEYDATLKLDCLRLVRRLVEETENLPPIDGIADLISSLATCLISIADSQEEAARALKNILVKGSRDHKDMVISTGAIRLLRNLSSSSARESIATINAIPALRVMVVGGEKKHIETFATPKAIDMCISVLGSKVAGVATDSLKLLVAAKDHISDAETQRRMIPNLAHMIKSPEHGESLGDCFVLLRHILEVDDPPIEAIVDSGIAPKLVETMATTVDEGVRTNLAHIMMDLAHHHCQILSNPGGEEQNAVLVKEAGYLSTLLDLRSLSCNEIATKALSTLQSIASSNVTEKWTSWKEKKTLAWGEYEVTGELVDLMDDDDDASFEEAEEVSDEHAKLEELQGEAAANRVQANRRIIDTFNVSYTESPTLMGMPDNLLEKILHLATVPDPRSWSDVIQFEQVCKRFCHVVRSDDFLMRLSGRYKKAPLALRAIRKYQKRSVNETFLVLCGEGEGIEDVRAETIRNLSATLLSKMIDSQTDQVPEVHFRLRGDAIWFLVEVVEGYMVEKLAQALLAAIHGHRTEVQKEDISFAFQKKGSCPTSFGSVISPSTSKQPGLVHPFDFSRYLPLDERGSGGDSHSQPSSDIVWRWPEDNCCDVLPPAAGRRIIRRLSFRAGIKEMSGGAFFAAESEMLYAWGILLADAYQSAVVLGETASYLKAEDLLVYRKPSISADTTFPTESSLSETDSTANEEQPDSLVRQIDMYKVPHPPFKVPREAAAEGEDCQHDTVHTIVPGLLEEAAERRGIGPARVYGNGWISTPGSTQAQVQDVSGGGVAQVPVVDWTEADWARYNEQVAFEREIEESYYFGRYDEDFPEGFYESDEDGQTESSGAGGQEAGGQESNEVSS